MKVVICGLASNCAKPMLNGLKTLLACFQKEEVLGVHIVESDSVDNTPLYLEALAHDNNVFSFESLGSLKQKIPNRIERIRHCRQQYVDWIRRNTADLNPDAVVVVDFDLQFATLSREKLDTLLLPIKSKKLGGVFPNTAGPYYDLYALRCSGWVMSDVWRDVEKFSLFMERQECLDAFIYSKQLELKGRGYLQVESAFGGLGVYSPEIFTHCDYGSTPLITCEHVEFHQLIASELKVNLAIAIDANLVVPPAEHIRPQNWEKACH